MRFDANSGHTFGLSDSYIKQVHMEIVVPRNEYDVFIVWRRSRCPEVFAGYCERSEQDFDLTWVHGSPC